ncbi:MAG: hypothetical protein V4506_10580 [Bacteroidota bacterium]
MTKINYSINSYADLDREEIRVRKRLKKQEEAIKLQLKTLPEEIVMAGITKLIAGIVSGNLFRSASSIIGVVKSAFSKKEESGESSGGGIMDLIKSVLKDKFSK